MLPLGLRVQDKVQKLINKHMASIGMRRLLYPNLFEEVLMDKGSSRLDLSSISSQELWAASGRLNAINSEVTIPTLWYEIAY